MTESEETKQLTGISSAPISIGTGEIYSKMASVMKRLNPISKEKINRGQGYKFRGIEDVYKSLQKLLAEEGITHWCADIQIIDRERIQNKSGGLGWHVLGLYTYVFAASDGSYLLSKAVGEGMDYGDKAFNKAASVSQKYALIQSFCIPTEDAIDPEAKDEDPAFRKIVDDVKKAFNGVEVHDGANKEANQKLIALAQSMLEQTLSDDEKRAVISACHGKPVDDYKKNILGAFK